MLPRAADPACTPSDTLPGRNYGPLTFGANSNVVNEWLTRHCYRATIVRRRALDFAVRSDTWSEVCSHPYSRNSPEHREPRGHGSAGEGGGGRVSFSTSLLYEGSCFGTPRYAFTRSGTRGRRCAIEVEEEGGPGRLGIIARC